MIEQAYVDGIWYFIAYSAQAELVEGHRHRHDRRFDASERIPRRVAEPLGIERESEATQGAVHDVVDGSWATS